MNYIKKTLFLPLSTLILSGCLLSTSIINPNLPLEKFSVVGRAALKAPDNSGQASFNWDQSSNNDFKLIIQGPLGSGRIDLDVTPIQSTLIADDQVYTGYSPDILFFDVTGLDWPISGMKSWLIGKPHQTTTQVYRDEKNRITHFSEDGWRIEYKQWDNYKKRDIPRNIELTRGDVRLRLLVEHWRY